MTTTQIIVNAGDDTNSISFTASVQLPTTGTAPYPAMIGIGGISLNSVALRNQGIAIINFNNNDIAQQTNRAWGVVLSDAPLNRVVHTHFRH